jgi:hypothetical protein
MYSDSGANTSVAPSFHPSVVGPSIIYKIRGHHHHQGNLNHHFHQYIFMAAKTLQNWQTLKD